MKVPVIIGVAFAGILLFVLGDDRSAPSISNDVALDHSPGPGPWDAAVPRVTADADISAHLLIAALPSRAWEVANSQAAFEGAENALRLDPVAVLPKLLERYSGEADPVIRGLLAVLLGNESSTHPRILSDYQDAVPGAQDLFRGLALFAVVTGREVEEEGRRSFWSNLVRFAGWAPKSLELERALRAGEQGEAVTRLSYEVHGIRTFEVEGTLVTTWSDPEFDRQAVRTVRGTRDPEIRRVLIETIERKEDWAWLRDVAGKALRNSAHADLEFAGFLFERFTDGRDRDRMLDGLEALSVVPIPSRNVATLESIARTSMADPQLFQRAVDLLAKQAGPEPVSILIAIHSEIGSRDELREDVLIAMRNVGSPSFEPAAREGLHSSSFKVRQYSLEVLATVAGQVSAEPLVHAALTDQEPDVRRRALGLMVEANRWSSMEEAALVRMAESDPHRPLRNLATRLRAAKDRTSDDAWDDSDLEPPGDLLDFSKEPEE